MESSSVGIREVLAIPDFRRLWTALSLSSLGDWLGLLALTALAPRLVDGIEEGLFPARPGDDDWRPGIGATHTNCCFCEFDHLCSSTRGEQWLTIRSRDELAPYVELAEGVTEGVAS